MSQSSENNMCHPLTNEHFRRFLMGTNNTIFHCATTAPLNDKKLIYPLKLKQAMEWPEWVNCDYDLKNYFGVYERLFQFTVISLCCDIEFFLKDLFTKENFQPRNGKGYFQRFSDVITDLKSFGAPLGSSQPDIDNLIMAFSIRHVAVHNFGRADDEFISKTNSTLNVGDHAPVDQDVYRSCSDSYRNFLKCIDQWLTLRSSGTAQKRAAP